LQAQFKLQVKESIHCHPFKLMSTSWLMSLEVAAKGSCSLQAHRQPAWPPTSRPTGQAGSPPAHPWDRARGQAAHRVGPCQPAHGPGTGQGRGLPMSPPPSPSLRPWGEGVGGPPPLSPNPVGPGKGVGGPPSLHPNSVGPREEGGPAHSPSSNHPLLDIWVGVGGKEVAMLPLP
jgi:hypothetical protein